MVINKCPNCSSDFRYGTEQVGLDSNNVPVYHRFGYCDKCKSKYDIDILQKRNEPVQKTSSKLRCPKCGSFNINVQAVTETQLKNSHHNLFWWIIIGWWWVPIKWLLFLGVSLLALIFAPKKQKLKTKHIAKCICQSCGNMWNA